MYIYLRNFLYITALHAISYLAAIANLLTVPNSAERKSYIWIQGCQVWHILSMVGIRELFEYAKP